MTRAAPPPPAWLDAGVAHLWRPYCQMKTAAPALPVAATEGSRLILADGRVLIDGIASWWTACHGYNHPHIAAAVRRQLEIMPHVMFGGLTTSRRRRWRFASRRGCRATSTTCSSRTPDRWRSRSR